MSILVVGSVGYDSVSTSFGKRDLALGGSATYFAISGSYFAPVGMVAVVGDDFSAADMAVLKSHHVDTSGLKTSPGKTFRWSGEYSLEDVNSRTTLDTQLNVFADFRPELSPQERRVPFLFLGNIDPGLQLNVLEQMEERPRLVAADTMNFWIEGKRETVLDVIRHVDVIFMDEGELRQFTGEKNVIKAAKEIISLGPQVVLAKRGEHGVLQFTADSTFAAPAYPLEKVVDPTGAGDSFAGGFMGYLAATGDLSPDGFRRATVMGSIMGSFAVQSFSVDSIGSLNKVDVESRFEEFVELTKFDGPDETRPLPWREVGAEVT